MVPVSPFPKFLKNCGLTMSSEITPKYIEVANLLPGGDAGAAADDRKLHTDVLSYDNSSRRGSASDRFINLRVGDTLNVSVGEGQMFLLHACVDRSDVNNPVVNWYHEIRSGL